MGYYDPECYLHNVRGFCSQCYELALDKEWQKNNRGAKYGHAQNCSCQSCKDTGWQALNLQTGKPLYQTFSSNKPNGTGNGSSEKVEDVLEQILTRLEAIEKELK